MGMLANNVQKCIDECNDCAQICYECFRACLDEPDVTQRKNCIALLVECAGMCKMSSGHMAMDGKYAKDYCKLCAIVCEECAKECAMFSDEHCTACAKECKECAAECNMMAGI